jgi:hypothetical protein
MTISNALYKASYIAGIACGTSIGYTLGLSGNQLTTALLTTSSAVAGAAYNIIIDHPLREQSLVALNEYCIADPQQKDAAQATMEKIQRKAAAFDMLNCARLGLSHGMALGTGGAEDTLLSGLLYGGSVFVLGWYTEMIPTCLKKPRTSITFDETGKLLSIGAT